MLSLIIPLYNEEALVDELIARSTAALESATDDYEIVCIDDGSSDRTLEKLLCHHERNSRVKIIVLSRNFGHQTARTVKRFRHSTNPSSGRVSKPLEAVEDQIQPELELIRVVVAGLHGVLDDHLGEIGVLVGTEPTEKCLGRLRSPACGHRPACSSAAAQSHRCSCP